MEVKKFEAFSIQDAIKLVRREFGKDAVILSTREKQGAQQGSQQNQSQTKLYEVVAARGSTSTRVLNEQEASQAKPFEFRKMRTRDEPQVIKSTPNLPQLNQETIRTAQSLSRPRINTQASQAAQMTTPNSNRNSPIPKFVIDTPAPAPAPHTSTEIKDLKSELTKLRKEMEALPQIDVGMQVQEIKVLLHEIMRSSVSKNVGDAKLHDFVTDLGVKMRAAGVMESICGDLLALISSQKVPREADGREIVGEKLREFYLNAAIREVFRQVQITGSWQTEAGEQSITALVGPTGVGKTTTIAKIAAKLKSEGKHVALISMDTFRIAAADQLRVYAKILDCPFAEVSDVAELQSAIQKYNDADYILIDTAGRSYRAPNQMNDLKAMNQMAIPIHFHMVLASTMKQRDMDENIKAFRFLSLESLLFTKLDESWSFGEIFNCNVRSKLPLSYFTTGQKVPDDLETASKERVVERLFRL